MDLMTREGTEAALERVYELWQAIHAARVHASESELVKLRLMADVLAALDCELQSWLSAWEGQR